MTFSARVAAMGEESLNKFRVYRISNIGITLRISFLIKKTAASAMKIQLIKWARTKNGIGDSETDNKTKTAKPTRVPKPEDKTDKSYLNLLWKIKLAVVKTEEAIIVKPPKRTALVNNSVLNGQKGSIPTASTTSRTDQSILVPNNLFHSPLTLDSRLSTLLKTCALNPKSAKI